MTFVDRLLRRATAIPAAGARACAGRGPGLRIGRGRGPFGFEPPLIGDAVAAERVRILVAADTKGAEPSTTEKAETPGKSRPSVDAEISISESGVTIRKRGGSDEPHVVVDDIEFDSFEEFVEKAPWLAALVFMVTGLVFLMPLLIIGLIIWYKVRSNRMRNETMLKLAERGVVPPDGSGHGDGSGLVGPIVRDDALHGAALRAGETGPQARGLVGPAQGRAHVGRRVGADVLGDAGRRQREQRRPRAAVRRDRLHRALVLRGAAADAAA